MPHLAAHSGWGARTGVATPAGASCDLSGPVELCGHLARGCADLFRAADLGLSPDCSRHLSSSVPRRNGKPRSFVRRMRGQCHSSWRSRSGRLAAASPFHKRLWLSLRKRMIRNPDGFNSRVCARNLCQSGYLPGCDPIFEWTEPLRAGRGARPDLRHGREALWRSRAFDR